MESNAGHVFKNSEYIIGHAEGINDKDVRCFTTSSGYLGVDPIPKAFKVERVLENAVLPEITKGNVGIDLRVLTENNEEKVVIQPNEFYKFRTGIKIEVPEGYYIDIVPRSSAGCKKTLRLMNTLGVIDNSFRGELLCFVHNFGKVPVEVQNNERLCQMIIRKDESINFVIKEVKELSKTGRGEGGFGSTNFDKSGNRVL